MSVIPIRDTELDVRRAIDELNRDYALVVVGGQPVIVRELYGDDESLGYEYLHVDAWRTLLSNRFVWQTADDKHRKVPVTKIWLESPPRR